MAERRGPAGGRFSRLLPALALTLLAPGALAGTLQVGSPGNPASLDPQRITGIWENRIVGDMFLGLTTEAADGSIVPGAAESWEVSADGRVYQFRIREHRWSDGRPVTAADFAWSFRRLLAPATAAAYADFFFVIAGAREFLAAGGSGELGVEALDERTLRITLEEPVAYFPGLLAHFAAMPVPRHAIEAHGDEWTRPGRIVVNGPFTLAGRVVNSHVELVRNEQFHAAGEVALDGVVYHVQENPEALLQRYRSGELHVVLDFPAHRTGWLREQLGTQVRTAPQLGLAFVSVNHRRPVLADRRVREALSLALEREVIAGRLLGGGEQPALAMVPPGAENHAGPGRPDWAQLAAGERLARAREQLVAAGYGPSRRLPLELRITLSEADRRVAVAAQDMWRRIGMDITINRAETAVHYASLQRGEFDLALASWFAVYRDAQTFTLLLETATTANNFGGYSNPDYDQLTARAARTLDPGQRAGLLAAAERLALDQHALLPVYHHASRNLVSPAVAGWVDNPLDVHRSRYLSLRPAGSPVKP